MGLPFSFLLGLAALFLHEHVVEVLPGAAQPWWLLAVLPALSLPPLLLRRLVRSAAQQAANGRAALARASLAVANLSVPAVFAALVFACDLPVQASELAAGSEALFALIGIGPLLLLEVLYRREQAKLAAGHARELLAPPSPMHFGLIGMVLIPLLLAAVALDLLAAHREVHVFLTATALGQLCSLLAGLTSFVIVLPLLFRWLLPVSTRLPADLAQPLRDTARALGFPPRAVLAMHTGYRLPNAAMVGFLRWPRYLVLTDALMRMLDVYALRGVVAHEVGHARAGHPPLLLLLVAGIPVLLAYPVQMLAMELDPLATGALGCLLLVVAIWLVHRLAHRFEFEADVQSAIALGGAQPCIDALRRVASSIDRVPNRATMLHPSDGARILTLTRWELDPGMRDEFVRRGRRVRTSLRLAGVAALACAGYVLVRLHPVDAAVTAYARGDFVAAQARLDQLLAEDSAMIGALRSDLTARVAAARELVPLPRGWSESVDQLAEGGLERGVQLLERGLPDQARVWLALANSREDAEPWRACLYLLATAAAEGDQARVDRIQAHLRLIDAPPEVLRAVGGVSALPRHS